MFAEVLHVIALIHHVYVTYYIFFCMDFSSSTDTYVINMDLYKCRFLTGWNFSVQTVYLSLCVWEDILFYLGVHEKNKILHIVQKHVTEAKNYMFGTYVFPTGVFVSFTFWALFSLDRELVFPRVVDAFFPTWTNHAIHTNTMIVVLMGLLLRPHYYGNKSVGFGGLFVFIFLYDLVYLWTYIHGGVWLYPIYIFLGTWTKQLLFMLVSNCIVFFLYMAGERLSFKIWGEELLKMREARRNQPLKTE